MKQAIQRFFAEIGEAACYALCLIALAEKESGATLSVGQVADYLDVAIESGFIKYNHKNPNDPDNFLVLDPVKILQMMTLNRFTVSKEPATYVPKSGELVIEQYKRSTPKGVYYHFVTPWYDPLGDSLTRAQGTLNSYRIFRRA